VAKTLSFFTGSIVRSASRRYLNYSEADFEDFRLAGATCCTDAGDICNGGGFAQGIMELWEILN